MESSFSEFSRPKMEKLLWSRALILSFLSLQVAYSNGGQQGSEVSDVDGVALFGLDRDAVCRTIASLPAKATAPGTKSIAPTKLLQRPSAPTHKVPRRQAGVPASGPKETKWQLACAWLAGQRDG